MLSVLRKGLGGAENLALAPTSALFVRALHGSSLAPCSAGEVFSSPRTRGSSRQRLALGCPKNQQELEETPG